MPAPFPAGAAWRVAALLPALLCLSCSGTPGLHAVRGRVLLKGEPVEGAVVTFHPRGADALAHRPVGQTAADGTFTLSTGQSPGAPAGEYTVTLLWPRAAEEKPGKGKAITSKRLVAPADAFQGAYANESASAIKVRVGEGENELAPFDLK